MNSGIYTITNTMSNKLYVGYAVDFRKRWNKHRRSLINGQHANDHLQAAWDQYGETAFVFEVLEECEQEYLKSQENYWCNLLNVHNNMYGYNIQSTNPHGITVMATYTKKKLSTINIGRKHTEATKKLIGECSIGRTHSQETKKLMSESAKRVKSSEEQKSIASRTHKGKKLSQDEIARRQTTRLLNRLKNKENEPK